MPERKANQLNRKILEKDIWDPSGSRVETLPNEIVLGSGKPGLMASAHWHAQIEINYVSRGRIRYEMHGYELDIAEGRVAVFWGGLPHRMSDFTRGSRLESIHLPLLHFFRLRLPEPMRQSLMRGATIVTSDATEEDRLAFNRWCNDLRSTNLPRAALATEELLLRIERLALYPYEMHEGETAPDDCEEASDHSGFTRIGAILDFVTCNFRKDIDASAIADSARIHPKYAMNVFKRSTGMTLNQYVQLLRLSYAQALLFKDEDSVLDIAMESGFGSLSHFNRTFRKHTGMSPSAFKHQTGQFLAELKTR